MASQMEQHKYGSLYFLLDSETVNTFKFPVRIQLVSATASS